MHDEAEQLQYKILYNTYWCKSITIKSISDVYGIVLIGFANLNDYYIFQSHGDYFKYIKLAGNNSVITMSRNNQDVIIIEFNGALVDINLIAFSKTVMQIVSYKE